MAASIPAYPPVRRAADLRALERRPLAEWIGGVESGYHGLRRSAAAVPDRAALVFLTPGETEAAASLTFAQLLERAERTAAMLRGLGLARSDVVTALLPLVPQAYEVLFGASATGIVSFVNPLLEPGQIAAILRASSTEALVSLGPGASPEMWAKVEALRGEVPSLRHVLVVDPAGAPAGTQNFDALRDAAPAGAPPVLPNGDQVAAYFHTGGTTGLPKLVRHTHAMQAAQIVGTGAAMGHGPGEVLMTGLPLFHIGGSVVSGIVPLSHGTTLVLPSPTGWRDKRAVTAAWDVIERWGVTMAGGVPTSLAAMAAAPPQGQNLASLRGFFTGGSATPEEVSRALTKVTGKPVVEGYGMTETTSYITLGARDGEATPGCSGAVLPFFEVKTVQLDGEGRWVRDCAVDEQGVVVMRGPCVTPGYVEPRHNKGAFVDGWLNSGDLGRFDAEGRLWLTGRAKDLIIRGGHNIDPAAIEEVVCRHPAVELAAAVGRPDAYAGEIPVVYVQLKAGSEADPDEIRAFIRDHIGERAAAPAALFVLKEMPLTGVGKIFKPKLRWDAAERTFRAALGDLDCAVRVGPDDRHGTLATVTVRGGDREKVEARIRETLGQFTIHHEVVWA